MGLLHHQDEAVCGPENRTRNYRSLGLCGVHLTSVLLMEMSGLLLSTNILSFNFAEEKFKKKNKKNIFPFSLTNECHTASIIIPELISSYELCTSTYIIHYLII